MLIGYGFLLADPKYFTPAGKKPWGYFQMMCTDQEQYDPQDRNISITVIVLADLATWCNQYLKVGHAVQVYGRVQIAKTQREKDGTWQERWRIRASAVEPVTRLMRNLPNPHKTTAEEPSEPAPPSRSPTD